MREKIIFACAIICILITGISINSEKRLNTVNNINVLKISTLAATNSRRETIIKNKEELDSEKPVQAILKSEDKGEDVVRIQTRLKKYGYNVVADGDYGDGITYAIMDFQQRHNLVPSGIASGETLADLYETPAKDNMYKPATQSLLTADDISSEVTYENTLNSVESTSDTNTYILVNVSQQKVYIFYGADHHWKLINTFSCGSEQLALQP